MAIARPSIRPSDESGQSERRGRGHIGARSRRPSAGSCTRRWRLRGSSSRTGCTCMHTQLSLECIPRARPAPSGGRNDRSIARVLLYVASGLRRRIPSRSTLRAGQCAAARAVLCVACAREGGRAQQEVRRIVLVKHKRPDLDYLTAHTATHRCSAVAHAHAALRHAMCGPQGRRGGARVLLSAAP